MTGIKVNQLKPLKNNNLVNGLYHLVNGHFQWVKWNLL
jgi:hypothetical protein